LRQWLIRLAEQLGGEDKDREQHNEFFQGCHGSVHSAIAGPAVESSVTPFIGQAQYHILSAAALTAGEGLRPGAKKKPQPLAIANGTTRPLSEPDLLVSPSSELRGQVVTIVAILPAILSSWS
jgi:hypothetical protein